MNEKCVGFLDKVPFLKGSTKRKLIAVGSAVLLVVVALFALFCGGGDSGVTKEQLIGFCQQALVEKYGKNAVKKFAFREVNVGEDESRAILKADVKIVSAPSITNPADEGVDINGTAVFYLQESGSDIEIVDLRFQ